MRYDVGSDQAAIEAYNERATNGADTMNRKMKEKITARIAIL